MIKPKELTMLAKYLVSLFKMVHPGIACNIHWLSDTDKELGYTVGKKGIANVYLNKGTHPYFEGLEKSNRIMMITGIAVHEFMHQILTNFVLMSKMLDETPKEQKQLFMTCVNIFEDSRIESFAPSYFAGSCLTSLEYCIQHIWDMSPEVKSDDPVFNQVLNVMIQYGDVGMYKGELSAEAEEVFDKIIPLFNAAIESKSAAVCFVKAKEAMKILLPYIPEDYADETTGSGESDSEGEDADEDGVGSTSASSSKSSRRKSAGKRAKKEMPSSYGSPKDSSKSEEDKEDGSEDKGEAAGDEGSVGGDGSGESDSSGTDGDIEEEWLPDGTSSEEIEEAAKTLEDELKRLASEEDAEADDERSDYDYAPKESPVGDKWVKTISHHKASSSPEMYAEYKEKVAADAHELAKLIKRQFRTKPGGKKRADHGDLNLMRYKDPNFKSPLIFDKKERNKKHSVAVMLLVDESGSMGSSTRIGNARLATAMLAEAMAEVNIPCCIVGHSGDSRYSCSVELEHYTTFKNSPGDRASIPMISARCQNRDGPAIRWATSILKKRPERKKLMIVISDGQPCADSYGGDEAIFDTKSAIRDAKRLHEIVGVVLEAGYATDILHTMYGDDFVECNSASNLKDSIAKLITKRCKEW